MTLLNSAALMEPERVVWPPGWVGHIPFAFWLVARLRPRIFVELGTHSGNSYLAFCQAIKREQLACRAFAVDTWQGDEHAGLYDEAIYNTLKDYHDGRYDSFSTLLRMTFDDAVHEFDDGSVDLLHIDGLHTYEAVKHDFETWRPKLSRRAVVLFHDTCVHVGTFGVHRLWDELAAQYPGFNFRHSHGLGVLLIGEDRDPYLLSLAQDAAPETPWAQACEYFRVLGARIEHAAWIGALEELVADRDRRLIEAEAALNTLRAATAEPKEEPAAVAAGNEHSRHSGSEWQPDEADSLFLTDSAEPAEGEPGFSELAVNMAVAHAQIPTTAGVQPVYTRL